MRGPSEPDAAVEASSSHPPLRATLAVLELARRIEPDIAAAIHWYRHTPIAELDGRTALQLVAQGRADAVMDFLRAIGAGDRD